MCNHQKLETIQHFLLECPFYTEFRKAYLVSIFTHSHYTDPMSTLFYIADVSSLKLLYYYVVNSLRLRSFVLNE